MKKIIETDNGMTGENRRKIKIRRTKVFYERGKQRKAESGVTLIAVSIRT